MPHHLTKPGYDDVLLVMKSHRAERCPVVLIRRAMKQHMMYRLSMLSGSSQAGYMRSTLPGWSLKRLLEHRGYGVPQSWPSRVGIFFDTLAA